MEQFDVVLVVLEDLLLLLNSPGLVGDVSHEAVHVGSDVLHLALDELQLCFRLEGHVLNLVLVLVVLEAYLVDFFVAVL